MSGAPAATHAAAAPSAGVRRPATAADELACRIAAAFEKNRAAFARIAGSRVASNDVDDVLAEAVERALNRRRTLRDETLLVHWLGRIVARTAIDRHRAARRRATAIAIGTGDAVTLFTRESCGCSVAIAKQLPPNHRDVLLCVDVEGTSLVEAATALGITVNAATVRLHRARKALRTRLHEHCGVTSVRACIECPCVERGCCN